MARNAGERCEYITILKWFVRYSIVLQPCWKDSEARRFESRNKRGKDSTAKSSSKQDVGNSRTKTKGLSSSEDNDIAQKQKPKENQKRKKKGKKLFDSDSDEDPLPLKIRKSTSVKKEEISKAKKSRRAISLDSGLTALLTDEEEVVPRKLK
nr:uncharacterized protein LOC131776856 [Pocillopora verrucosa]